MATKIPNRLFFFLATSTSLIACAPGNKGEDGRISLNEIGDLKTRQYAIEGQALYESHCANCHQQDGSGLGQLIPPLTNADFMLEDTRRTVQVIKHGLEGKIMVNGIEYDHPMPANPRLSHLEIAEIATYIYTVFGKSEKLVDVKEVKTMLEE